jgi:hypothetical protein
MEVVAYVMMMSVLLMLMAMVVSTVCTQSRFDSEAVDWTVKARCQYVLGELHCC